MDSSIQIRLNQCLNDFKTWLKKKKDFKTKKENTINMILIDAADFMGHLIFRNKVYFDGISVIVEPGVTI